MNTMCNTINSFMLWKENTFTNNCIEIVYLHCTKNQQTIRNKFEETDDNANNHHKRIKIVANLICFVDHHFFL